MSSQKLLQLNLTEVMHNNDQLKLQQQRRAAFKHFHEGVIHFRPTFKFVPGTDEYSGKRVPSWTDRVLWMVRHKSQAHCSVNLRYYLSIDEMKISDHRPVIAGFEVAIKPATPQAEEHRKIGGCTTM